MPTPSDAFPDGGWIADDDLDRVHVEDTDLDLLPGDYAFIDIVTNHLPIETTAPDLREFWAGDDGGMTPVRGAYTALRVPHPEPVPSDMREPGQTCLRVEVGDGEVGIGQYVYYRHDDGEGQWYSQLHPGAPYRAEVWLRQEGLADEGRVGVFFTESYAGLSQDEPWVVTDEWQHFTYDFVAPEHPTDNVWHIAQGLQFTGPGALWIEGLVVYRNDEEHGFAPFGPHAVSFDELRASMPPTGPKPVIRFQPTTYQPHAMLESMLGDHGNSSYRVAWNASIGHGPDVTIAQALTWALATGDGPEDRAVPMLVCPEEYSEQEWMGLVEYLGVPYDPATDTPQSKPWAHRRYVYRGGDGAPWTDEFREVLLEFGNETWHNGAGGYGWDGFGPPDGVHSGGKEYGLFARYMWDEHVAQMPEWTEYGLADTIKFVLGANYQADSDSYGELAAQQGAPVAYLGHANYVGPKWETDDEGSTVFDDHGVQETLVGMHTGVKDLVDAAAAMRDELAAAGAADYTLMAYEGGPGGYWTNPDDPEVDELYGKSLAMGVAALDAWLYSSSRGYTHQAYLAFSSGRWWSSHTMPEAGGLRPHPGWLALTLRGRHARGRQMTNVDVTDAPTWTREDEDVPLISSYALRDEDAWSVFVLSRKLDGEHDGHDFGDGHTPTTIHLPFDAPSGITLHRLARPDGTDADPRENNRDAANVAIVSEELDPSTFNSEFVVEGGMPPGTAYLYVFELAGSGDDDDGPPGSEPATDGCGCGGGAGAMGLLVVGVPGLRRRRRRGNS